MADGRTKEEDEDPEVYKNLVAPCRALLITPSELKRKYPKYHAYMHEVSAKGSPRAREFADNIPRIVKNDDYQFELKIANNEALEEMPEDDEILDQVYVYSSKGPHEFSYQLVKYREELKELESLMKIFYEDLDSHHSNPKYVLATGAFIGSHYAVFSNRLKRWTRCISNADVPVIRPNESLAQVTLVDYAVTEIVQANRLRPLIPSFCLLPAQGYIGGIWDCRQTDPNRHFIPAGMCAEFHKKALGKVFDAFVLEYKSEDWREQGPIKMPRSYLYLVNCNKDVLCVRNDYNGNRILVDVAKSYILPPE